MYYILTVFRGESRVSCWTRIPSRGCWGRRRPHVGVMMAKVRGTGLAISGWKWGRGRRRIQLSHWVHMWIRHRCGRNSCGRRGRHRGNWGYRPRWISCRIGRKMIRSRTIRGRRRFRGTCWAHVGCWMVYDLKRW